MASYSCDFNEKTRHHEPNLTKRQMLVTLAALVLALANRDAAVSGFSPLKNDIDRAYAKSSAFHLK
jgi:hypothetical protein